MALSPDQRSSRARVGAHASWANTRDVTARLAPANEARLRKFYEATPADLPEADRERMARHALTAHMRSLAVKSAKVRAARKAS